ncbi:MAG: hypothetical protein ABSD20_12930 [Terriglobales bacterium]|jgi:hypothetical protein
MPNDKWTVLELLKFELKFLEDGGYGRPTKKAWQPTYIFEDSPSCLNFDDPARTEPCAACWLTQFVPAESRREQVPCRHIPLNEKGDTVHSLYQHGTQLELEEALGAWLRKRIAELEAQGEATGTQAAN